jgi:hypothetical protein
MRQNLSEGTNGWQKSARVNSRVTRKFKLRLEWAVADRQEDTPHRVTEGDILSELADYLKPHPDEEPLGRRPPGRAQVSAKTKAKGRTA